MPPKKQDKKDPDYKPKTKVETSPRESSIRQLAVRLKDSVIGKGNDEATGTSAQGTSLIKQLSDSRVSSGAQCKSLKQTVEEFHPYLKAEVEQYICNQFREDSELTSDEEGIEAEEEDLEHHVQQILNPTGFQTQPEINPIGTAVQQLQVPVINPIQPLPAPQEVDMAAIEQIRASLEELATSNRRNNPALLSDLPYFGIPAQKDTKKIYCGFMRGVSGKDHLLNTGRSLGRQRQNLNDAPKALRLSTSLFRRLRRRTSLGKRQTLYDTRLSHIG